MSDKEKARWRLMALASAALFAVMVIGALVVGNGLQDRVAGFDTEIAALEAKGQERSPQETMRLEDLRYEVKRTQEMTSFFLPGIAGLALAFGGFGYWAARKATNAGKA